MNSPSPPKLLKQISVPVEAALKAKLILRYKRFLADIALEDGSEITVHCPNPGSMTGTKAPGSSVRCSTHDSKKRKLRHTLEMIRVGRVWVAGGALEFRGCGPALVAPPQPTPPDDR